MFMIQRFFFLLVVLLAPNGLAGAEQDLPYFSEPEAKLVIGSNKWRSIEIRRMFYLDVSLGRQVPSEELYMFLAAANGYPYLMESFVGHHPSLELVDLDGDQTQEVLLRYKAGANQTILVVYRKALDGMRRVPGDVLASNMDSITKVGREIVVRNNIIVGDERKLTESRFCLKSEGLIEDCH